MLDTVCSRACDGGGSISHSGRHASKACLDLLSQDEHSRRTQSFRRRACSALPSGVGPGNHFHSFTEAHARELMRFSMLDRSPTELVLVEGTSPTQEACLEGLSGSTPVRMTTREDTVFRLSTCSALLLGLSWGDLCPLYLRPTRTSSFSRARTMISKKLFTSPSLHTACCPLGSPEQSKDYLRISTSPMQKSPERMHIAQCQRSQGR